MKRTTLSIAAICGILFALAVPTFASVVETGLLYQGQSDEYSIKLYAGTTYEIAAISDTYDCDLDLYVYDSDGDIVAVDNTNSSDAYVTYKPSRTQVVTIEVHAHSGDFEYALAVAP